MRQFATNNYFTIKQGWKNILSFQIVEWTNLIYKLNLCFPNISLYSQTIKPIRPT